MKNELKDDASVDLSFGAEYSNIADVNKETFPIILQMNNILESCYELNENEIPARYRLKYLTKIFKEYNEKVIIVACTSRRVLIVILKKLLFFV